MAIAPQIKKVKQIVFNTTLTVMRSHLPSILLESVFIPVLKSVHKEIQVIMEKTQSSDTTIIIWWFNTAKLLC